MSLIILTFNQVNSVLPKIIITDFLYNDLYDGLITIETYFLI
jgi:hypothetical protein